MSTPTIDTTLIRHNAELAAIFHQMATCYRFLGKEHRSRTIAYDNASRALTNLKEDISIYASDADELEKLQYIGEGIGEKIIEYLETGRIQTFGQLKEQVPLGLLEFMDIKGFGPATVKTIHEKLHVKNRQEMLEAIEAGKLDDLKGFGPKRIDNMKRALKLLKESHTRLLLPDALKIGNDVLRDIRALPGVQKAELAGSLRRRKETIGDIDIVVMAGRKDWRNIVNKFSALPVVGRVLARGDTRASIILSAFHTQVDIRLVQDSEYGSALLYFTGSKEHTIALRTWVKTKKWKLSEYGVFDAGTGKWLAGTTEEEVYALFGMQFIPPELREGSGEIEKARKHLLPVLIDERDIRGDMHLHTTWSDGAEDIETIARYIRREFPQYDYIVISDHSPSENIANGLQPAEFIQQFAEIDRVNKELGVDLVKKGVEVDILADGSLDLPDELLAQFEWVTASIHSGFNKDNTDRLLKACEHPCVHCIGHPSGRLIGKRDPYTVNWKKLIEKAAATGTVLEINAQPDRLDLKDELVKAAIEKGVKVSVSTDAHALRQFDFMPLGVAVARRGWCAGNNILNTLSWKEVQRFKQYKPSVLPIISTK